MTQDNRHKSFLNYIKKVVDVPSGYSKDDLITFRSMATHQYPVLVPVLDEFIHLAERSDSPVLSVSERNRVTKRASDVNKQMHLFDLLREKKLFPQNVDLVEFAGRILPEMRAYRYDKMSKSDIAARMVEYLETLEPRTKTDLEKSMRTALTEHAPRESDRKSFLDTWERIIKGSQS